MQATQAQAPVRNKWLARFCAVDVSFCLRVGAAFAAIYLIWGSTYLAIRFAIDSLPPFFMAGVRFLIAGSLLYAWTRLQGVSRPARLHWREAGVIGGLMLLGGNGGVTWAEQRVSSGLAALMIATVPLWMVLLEAVRPGGTRPTGRTGLGVALGLAGMALLIGPWRLGGGPGVDMLGAGVLLLAALAWTVGSLYSRQARLPAAPLQATGMEMLAGGLWLMVAAGLTGEWDRLDLASVTPRSWLALGYLVIFGSLLAFTAYVWLLRVSTPARASTYAFVNPVVAVGLGWALAGEPLSARTLLAAAVIVAAVALITTGRSPAR